MAHLNSNFAALSNRITYLLTKDQKYVDSTARLIARIWAQESGGVENTKTTPFSYFLALYEKGNITPADEITRSKRLMVEKFGYRTSSDAEDIPKNSKALAKKSDFLTLNDRVRHLLIMDHEFRDSDEKLVARIWAEDMGGIEKSKQIPLYDFLCTYVDGKITPADSITRARRNLQKAKELQGKKYEERQKNKTARAKKIIKSVTGNINVEIEPHDRRRSW